MLSGPGLHPSEGIFINLQSSRAGRLNRFHLPSGDGEDPTKRSDEVLAYASSAERLLRNRSPLHAAATSLRRPAWYGRLCGSASQLGQTPRRQLLIVKFTRLQANI